MIEAALYIALGFCTAGLIGLAILPAFYRRAARLTEEALRAVNPSSYAEVRAAQDQVRARHAIELRRVERQLDGEREKAAHHQLEVARLKAAIDELKKSHREELSARETKISSLVGDQHAVDLLSAEVKTLKQKLADAEKALAESWTTPVDDRRSAAIADKQTDDTGWLPATDTMTLATITGLEAEVATLKAKLAHYEPTVASQMEANRDETARTNLAKLEAQLVDTESKYVSAQAEVTRLTLMLDAVNISEPDLQNELNRQIETLTGENNRNRNELRTKERELERLSGQMQKLRKDLEDSSALVELRKDFRALAARLSDTDAGPAPTEAPPQTSLAPLAEAPAPAAAAHHPQRVQDANGSSAPVGETAHTGIKAAGDSRTALKSAEIADAAEALVGRIVASSRGGTSLEIEAEAARETPTDGQTESSGPTDSAPETKPSKQKKKVLA